ncbi:hypothetical protein IE81DRAFT_341531 [Ceraceosorus guamensis]|uniref:SAC domain-containing protein n=1 Tax=Ceraceosorus guamensis TaxID=1522189 RepID=A0A316VX18_9BASI|nr:hypothetical protein IE81DRAFT_341531 [Ceraceosorus guamensis]PWN42197.1 hypothetical protein IE81DRAFT_341531 [Ceraceosorus guamensis]
MKGFFARPGAGRAAGATPGGAANAAAGALASLSLPDYPQPLPEKLLSIHVTEAGLFIIPQQPHHHSMEATTRTQSSRPAPSPLRTTDEARSQDVAHEKRREDGSLSLQHSAPLGASSRASTSAAGGSGSTAVKISWGRSAKVSSLTVKQAKEKLSNVGELNEGAETLAYGVVGLIRVFKAAYLLVVTSRTHAGDFLHTSCPVYRSTGVLSIPLEPQRAREALRSESLRQAKVPAKTQSSSSSSSEEEDEEEPDDVQTPAALPRTEDEATIDADTHAGGAAALAVGGAATMRPARSGPWLLRNAHGKSVSESGPGAKAAAATSPNDAVDAPSPVSAAISAAFEPAGAVADATLGAAASEGKIPALSADERYHEALKAELEEKVVTETAKQYARGEMLFSYDFDLTTPLQRKNQSAATPSASTTSPSSQRGPTALPWEEPNARLPLWKRADSRFWHNQSLSKDFVDAGLHGFVLPLVQGFFQVAQLPVDNPSPPGSPDVAGDAMDEVSAATASLRSDAYLLIISRRSKERAGLRYQRRGIAEDGSVANYVETEQVLLVRRYGSSSSEPKSTEKLEDATAHTLAFVQFRGSIPLFWTQSPFHLKPPPQLERSANENANACARHFDLQVARYGSVTCVNLAEQGGKEGVITEAYRKAVENYGGTTNESTGKKPVRYVPFDFHKECAGMKFENVSRLLGRMKEEDVLTAMDFYWRSSGTAIEQPKVFSMQKGAFRVSCLDCLDRTNVVQSAFARYMLGVQLQRLGLDVPAARGERDEAFDYAFNDSWANNGDMVSQIYAGTRALKGDFTRTGKRNLFGMMNDATASVYRMVQGAVTDFFKQTVMDFQYGYINTAALERYNDNLAAQDPSEQHRLARVRAGAIDSCASQVLGEDEIKLAGWTLMSPIEPNRIQSAKLEEKVVLLTSKALYSCGWDFTAEKLSEYSRIRLGDVTSIQKGTYILAPHEGYHPEKHWGLIVRYIEGETRVNSATSMRNVAPPAEAAGKSGSLGDQHFVAFRAVADDFVGTLDAPEPSEAATSSAPSRRFWRLSGKTGSIDKADSIKSPDESVADTPLTSHDIVDRIVALVVEQCADAGACDPGAANAVHPTDENEEDRTSEADAFVKEETIQSLAQAKANAGLFAPLIEGLKRRVWL